MFNKVSSKADLVRLLKDAAVVLRKNPQDWPNGDLMTFLDAWAAWLEDMEGYFKNRNEPIPERPDWKVIAAMVAAARIYE